MADELKLPAHITPAPGSGAQPTWYWNEKSKKWIHADRIVAFCAAYWSHRPAAGDGRAKVSYKQNIKGAARRWADDK